jgi:hypothetical protein
MRRSTYVVLHVAVALLFHAPASAQEQRAAIEGIIRDTQGGAAGGTSVQVHSTTGVGAETTTDGAGVYRFAALPPGRYEVAARRPGFVPARVVNVDLRLGQELHIDVTLRPAGPSETVEVVSESPLVAITQSQHATNLREEEITKMPRGRDLTSLATQATGVNNEAKLAGLSIDGSSSAENRVIIDGAETLEIVDGSSAQGLVTDFVEELQVKSSGYSAEYGGSTGGVLNAITRSGSNEWHGDALVYWSSDELDASPRPSLRLNPSDPSRAEYVTYPEDAYHKLEPGFTLGGPILRDRLWLFAGYIPAFRPTDRTVTFLSDSSTASFHQLQRTHNAAASLSAQLGSRWRSRLSFSTGSQKLEGQLPAQDGSSNSAADYATNFVTPNYSVAASVDFTPSRHALVSFRATYFRHDQYSEGIYEGDQYRYSTSAVGLAGVPPQYQQPLGYTNVISNYASDDSTRHLVAQLDGTLFVSAGGEHQLKAGVQLDRRELDLLEGNTGNMVNLWWGQRFQGSGGPFGYYVVFSNPIFPNRGLIAEGKPRVNNLGLFIQDEWRIGKRLTLHLGLRTENEHVPSFAIDPLIPETAIHFDFGDKLAPRAGFAWDASGDGRSKLYGSWGVFYDIMKWFMPGAYFGGVKAVRYWYTLDSGDISPIIDNPDCPPACPGSLILGPVNSAIPANDPDNNQIDPAVQPMRLQEAVIGLERTLRPNLSVGLRYVHKQLDRAIETIGALDPAMNLVPTIGNPGFGRAASFYPRGGTSPLPSPKAKRDYDAVELALDRRMSKRWSARASYTWSRLHGNYSGLVPSDQDGAHALNSSLTFDYPLMSFDEQGTPIDGPLATDRTHQLKVHALVDLPFGTSVGASWFAASGIPRTRQAAFVPGPFSFPVFYQGRASDGRLPFVSQLDLYLQHQLRLSARASLTFSANVTNILNQATAINFFQNELFANQAVAVDETQFYSTGVDTQALIAQQGLVRDARFLLDSAYQAPRSVRLGLKLGF